jgi:hypothetical protein
VIWLLGCFGTVPPGLPVPDSDSCVEQTWFLDQDGDGWGDQERVACVPHGDWVDQRGDCDDDDPTVHPGQIEWPCDGVDNDCLASTVELDGASSTLGGVIERVSLDGGYTLADGEVLGLCGGGTHTGSLTLVEGTATVVGDGSTLTGEGVLIHVALAHLTVLDLTLADAATGIVATGSDVVLRGVTARDHSQGGVNVTGGSLDAQGLVLSDNQRAVGGGLATQDTQISLQGLLVVRNTATEAGGGVSLRGGEAVGPVCADCVFLDNAVERPGLDPGMGGGMEIVGVVGDLTDTQWADNRADHGGALYAYGTTLSVQDGVIEGGTAERGAGVYADGAALTVSGLALQDNTATSQGGSVFLTNSTLSASDTEWRDNAPDDVYSNGPWTADGATAVDCGVTSLCE